MSESIPLSRVESALSSAWGGDVQLSFQAFIADHPHVARLAVQKAPTSMPPTVIVKRWRIDEQDPNSREFSASLLAREWASIRLLSTVLGGASPAPQLYAGDLSEGFLVMEDLGDRQPLKEALWGGDRSKGAQALVVYGDILGQVHGKTANQSDLFTTLQRQLNPHYTEPNENYLDMFQAPIQTLERIGIEISPSALDDIGEASRKLTQPGNFTAFGQGDPVEQNFIEWQGRWRIIDFEAGIFHHALLEGVFPRLFFPTSGLKYMLRLPEDIWRQAEAAYRVELSRNLPDAADDALYQSGLTAACAFWTLSFCHTWLERAIAGDDPVEVLKRIRQCTIARFEQFVNTSNEFQNLTHLGKVFEKLAAKLRGQWSEEACNLPFYPAFGLR
jgi:hypothetical protein